MSAVKVKRVKAGVYFGYPSGELYRELKKAGAYFKWVDSEGQVIIYPHPEGMFAYEKVIVLPKECNYTPEKKYRAAKIGNLFLIAKTDSAEIKPPIKKVVNPRKIPRSKMYRFLKEVFDTRRLRYDIVHYNGYLYILIWNKGLHMDTKHSVTIAITNKLSVFRYIEEFEPKVYNLYGYKFIRIGKLAEGEFRDKLMKKGFVRLPKYGKLDEIEDVDYTVKGRKRPYLRKTNYRMYRLFLKEKLARNDFPMIYKGKYRIKATILFTDDKDEILWRPEVVE